MSRPKPKGLPLKPAFLQGFGNPWPSLLQSSLAFPIGACQSTAAGNQPTQHVLPPSRRPCIRVYGASATSPRPRCDDLADSRPTRHNSPHLRERRRATILSGIQALLFRRRAKIIDKYPGGQLPTACVVFRFPVKTSLTRLVQVADPSLNSASLAKLRSPECLRLPAHQCMRP